MNFGLGLAQLTTLENLSVLDLPVSGVKGLIHSISCLIFVGVPKMKRGEIWKFLAKQCDLRALPEEEQFWKHGTYEEMKEGSSNHQHSIFIDLGK